MKKIEVLEHTADVRLRIAADRLPDLFECGAEGMNELLRREYCREQPGLPLSRTISLQAPDLTALLIDFLSEILTLTYTEKALFCRVRIDYLDKNRLEARLWGAPIDRFDEDIKAVTYHEAEVKCNRHGAWETTLIFDI